ncbi:MAG TPA: hypothetical protein VHS09_08765, partial [Polyangiaceae bacterium]|nr:hypothetical protein [Polyangiaceae bacterium]
MIGRRSADIRRPHAGLGLDGEGGTLAVVLLRLRITEEGHQSIAQPLEDVAPKPGDSLCRLVEVDIDQ